jgi:hypothetical protein
MVRRLPMGDIAQLQTEFVFTFPTGITLRGGDGKLKELPWEKVEAHISANYALWRVPIELFSIQTLISKGIFLTIEGIAYHYQCLQQDISERLKQVKNTTVQRVFDYSLISRPWILITLFLVTCMTIVSTLDWFDQSLCKRPNIISVGFSEQSIVYVLTDNGLLKNEEFYMDPVNVITKGFYPLPGKAYGITVVGNYVYIANGTEGLRIVDVKDPANPIEVGSYDTPGQATGVVVAGRYAYIADGTEGLRIVDIKDRSNPVEVGLYDTPGQASGISVERKYVYIADGNAGLRIISVRTPASPSEVGSYDTPGQASNVVVAGGYAYVADGTEGLRIVDVKDPTNPVEVSFQDTPDQVYDIVVEGDIAYVADGIEGLRVIFLRDLDATPQVIPIEGAATKVVLLNDYAFVGDNARGVQIIDVINPCDDVSKLADRDKHYFPMGGIVNGIAVPEMIKRPIGSISSEFFFWTLLFFPIISLARLLYKRISLRHIDTRLVMGADWPFWLALIFLTALTLFHTWTLTWS